MSQSPPSPPPPPVLSKRLHVCMCEYVCMDVNVLYAVSLCSRGGRTKGRRTKKKMNVRQADRKKEKSEDISRGRRGRASSRCGAREALARGPRPQEGRAGISSRPGEQTLTRLRCFLRTRRTVSRRFAGRPLARNTPLALFSLPDGVVP